jgi:nucleoside-diphosphate-sugar epimerase
MFREMVEKIVNIVGSGKIEYIEWPQNYEKIETGNFEIDNTKLKLTGWSPLNSFEEGIHKTCDFYKKYRDYYFK